MLKILGISDLLEWAKGGVEVLKVVSEILRWLVKKIAPSGLTVGFFVGPIGAVLLNDEIWTTVANGTTSMVASINSASATMGPWLSRINYVFPLSEGFGFVAFLAAVAVLSLTIRLTKAAVEFILEIIPF